ncbi:MAG: hypothetical protein ACM30G_23185 [Micromonosporaceae bacterium]
MAGITPGAALASLARLRRALESHPAAGARSRLGTSSTIEFVDQWAARIQRGEMHPEALPFLYHGQARRHHREAGIVSALETEERTLRRAAGQTGGYGARWYFGRHVLDDD